MKASELIERLQKLIEMYGDRGVITDTGSDVDCINLTGGHMPEFEINREFPKA